MHGILYIYFIICLISAGIIVGCTNNVKKSEDNSAENVTSTEKVDVVEKEAEMMKVNDLVADIIDDNFRSCYEIFVYSFYDSDGDGIGDIKGVTSKLDYISDLRCNEIWLMPIMPSTTYHKYDVKDYKNIDEQYGTMEDFEELVSKCHEKDIHIIIDFVINHSSSQHKWFTTASEYLKKLEENEEPNPTECQYVDYYNFSRENKPGYCQLSNSNWYYEARFWSEMPDLNLANKSLRKEITDTVQFWLDKGVDGFRLDAVKEYYSDSSKESIDTLEWFTQLVKEKKNDAYLVGEAWTDYTSYARFYRMLRLR